MRHSTCTFFLPKRSFILGNKNEEKALESQGKVEGPFAQESLRVCVAWSREAVFLQFPCVPVCPLTSRGGTPGTRPSAPHPALAAALRPPHTSMDHEQRPPTGRIIKNGF